MSNAKNTKAVTQAGPSLADLAPSGIDGRLWVKTLKEQLLSSKNGEPTNEELLYFARVCQASGLDPARREIYGIYRSVKQSDGTYKPRLSIQTSIDGLRVIAERSGQYAGSEEPQFVYEPDTKITVQYAGSQRVVPNRAKVSVRKIVKNVPYLTTRTAAWQEFYPGDTLGTMWKKMPEVMLSKVAEAQALRVAFPNSMEGLYIEEEMQQADGTNESGTDMEAIRQNIKNAKSYEDLMDILSECTAEVQKIITPLVDERAKELKQDDAAEDRPVVSSQAG